MRRVLRNVGCLFILFFLLPILGGCNEEDDVIEILTGKTWKLSRLTTENSKDRFLPNLWTDETSFNNSMTALDVDGNFTLSFTGSEVNGEIVGTLVEARGIRASTTSGSWRANGKNNTLTISVRVNGTETDPLAKAFMAGLQNVYKYEGDTNTLTLFYKEGQTTKIMGFRPE